MKNEFRQREWVRERKRETEEKIEGENIYIQVE